MADPLASRLAVARALASAYADDPRVAAVLAAGSVGAGRSDDHSDLDIDVYWTDPPSETDRARPVSRVDGRLLTLHPFEDDEWADAFVVQEMQVGTSMFLTDTMDRYLSEVIDRWTTADLAHIRIAALQHGRVMHGAGVVGGWRERASTYPDGLRMVMLRYYLSPQPAWATASALAERGDLVHLAEVTSAAMHAVLGALHALNRRYVPHPTFKWWQALIAPFDVAPDHLGRRVALVYRSGPVASVATLQRLLEDTIELAATHVAEFDGAEPEAWIKARRAAS
jgi:hypothetical protein